MFGHHQSRALCRYLLLALGPLWVAGALAEDAGARAPVVVSMVKGEVHAASGARDIVLKQGAALELPVSIRVGADGALELHQGATVVSAAGGAQLQIPKASAPDQTLDRIVQSQGNVYYSVAKRPTHKLRVETPLLVAVIKGTRFNVSALDAMTTISLLEGSIEVHASDDSSVVDLSAGQMATRSRSQPAIRVITMSTGEVIRFPAHTVGSTGRAVGEREQSADRSQDVGLARAAGAADAVAAPVAITTGNRRVPVVTPTSGFASEVATAQGDDHGASSALTLNQLVTRASSGGDSGSVGVNAGTGASASAGAGAGASGSGGAGLGAGPSSGSSGPGGTGGPGGDGGPGGAGSPGGDGGTGVGGTGGAGHGSNGGGRGTGAGSPGTNSGQAGAGTGSQGPGGSGTSVSTGSPGGPGLGSADNGATHGKDNSGSGSTPGNSGIAVTPGSGPGTSSASTSDGGSGSSSSKGSGSSDSQGSDNSNAHGPGNSLSSTLQSLLNKKKK
jgi:collagen type III alpha